ncbi:DJ-1/PfpI family protein [Vibrio parahaemolyticus]
MNVAILTFDGFNELDSFIASGVLGRMKKHGWNVQITSPTEFVTSMNGVVIMAQQPLEFANQADVVLFGSGIKTKEISKNQEMLSRLSLDPRAQLIGAQCSGSLLLLTLGLLKGTPACTDTVTKPWIQKSGIEVLEQPFYASGNIATSGGCLSSYYLAAWVIYKLVGRNHAEAIIKTVAPVGQKDATVKQCMSVIGNYV